MLYARSRRKNRTVADAQQNGNWIKNLNLWAATTTNQFLEYARLWQLVSQIDTNTTQEDQTVWKLTASGQYTTSSVYKVQFIGCTRNPHLNTIWNAWAPPKCKHFAWLIVQNHIWVSDMAKRNWDIAECRYTRKIWDLVAFWGATSTAAAIGMETHHHSGRVVGCDHHNRGGPKKITFLNSHSSHVGNLEREE